MNTFTIESAETLLLLRSGVSVKSVDGHSLIPVKLAILEFDDISPERPVEVVAQSPIGDIVSYAEGTMKATFRVLDIDDNLNATLLVIKDNGRFFGDVGDVVWVSLNSLEHEPVIKS